MKEGDIKIMEAEQVAFGEQWTKKCEEMKNEMIHFSIPIYLINNTEDYGMILISNSLFSLEFEIRQRLPIISLSSL